MFHVKHFDVIIVGGGHAGAEAAHVSARAGARTGLITLDKSKIGVMSCNPAIGGLGKGHLVREIDALGGIMGLAADYAGIQFRLLNRRKGPAVQGPRAQADRERYMFAIQGSMSGSPNLEIIEGEVADLLLKDGDIAGVELGDGAKLAAQAVVLTTGTFLRGVVHIGEQSFPAGRLGETAATRLADRLYDLDLPIGRLKTGTPPRIDGNTIDWESLEAQPGDDDPTMFSFLSQAPEARQVTCGITHTNARTHDIIRENLERSAMYGGHIDGIGPRYCPSIEDKIVRFADKTSHQVFLEPEGLNTSTVYPNGISTSLPEDVQHDYVRSIKGLELAKILQPGYAIEYDFVDPRSLDAGLQLSAIPGLYLAGQINGTTGYEEAAGQGLIAGLNAARRSQDLEPQVFSRSTSYIGVMIDDLVTRSVTEPYRMFTSRAEYRLSLRADNADQRLTELGRDLHIVSDERWNTYSKKRDALSTAQKTLSSIVFTPNELRKVGVQVNEDGTKRSAFDLFALPQAGLEAVNRLVPNDWPDEVLQQLARDGMYANYIDRQRRDVERLEKDQQHEIPRNFDYSALGGLSNELKGKLEVARPMNLAQAGRIEGMTPSALVLILSKLKSAARKSA